MSGAGALTCADALAEAFGGGGGGGSSTGGGAGGPLALALTGAETLAVALALALGFAVAVAVGFAVAVPVGFALGAGCAVACSAVSAHSKTKTAPVERRRRSLRPVERVSFMAPNERAVMASTEEPAT